MHHSHTTINTHIFVTGGTGYIGGSVLTRLINHPLSDTFQLTVLVRSAEKAKRFRTLGIRAIVGTYEETALLKRLASEADIVIACANADSLSGAKAILEGLKERYNKTGRIPSLLHTSGTGVLVDDAQGMYSTDKVYSDIDTTHLDALPITQPHRIVDFTLIEASARGFVKTYIILPGTIYGTASGPLIDLGLQNPHSQQIPELVEVSLHRQQGGMVGQGKNMWPNVHISDVADLFILIFEKLLLVDGDRRLTPAHGYSGYFFCENGEHDLHSVAKAIAQVLYDLGLSKTPSPSSFTEKELREFFPDGTTLGSNSRCRAERGKILGWEPQHTTKDMLASIEEEVERLSRGL
ncbi:hypothetical protein AX15_005331 [Amanita polypyramis BW_CC]|nr:hypothetical protein AX15_005331 [Amanita polypyramis BW_CC]